jgi:hypothetical protein
MLKNAESLRKIEKDKDRTKIIGIMQLAALRCTATLNSNEEKDFCANIYVARQKKMLKDALSLIYLAMKIS